MPSLANKVDKAQVKTYSPIFSPGIERRFGSYYFRDSFGVVTVKITAVVAYGAVVIDRVIAELPKGFRPLENQEIPVVYYGGAAGTITVRTSGTITFAIIPTMIEDIRLISSAISYAAELI